MVKIVELKTGKVTAMQDRFARTLVKIGKHAYVDAEMQSAVKPAPVKKPPPITLVPELVGAEARVMTPESQAVDHSVGGMMTNRALVPGAEEQLPALPVDQSVIEDENSTSTRRRKRNYARRDMTAEEN